MLRSYLASSRALRVGALALVTFSATLLFFVDNAEARRHRYRRHHVQSYSPAFASIIVDGNSGAVLSSSNPDAQRHPASLTKIMTLYLLFERLESGKMSLDTEMDVSKHASQQAPTKLGLRPGQTLRVEDAIKGLVTRSANDAAAVIAEAIAGDEDDFAKLMTRKARALGMTRTVYRNASGLPDEEQVTTARDQSVLGRAIQDRFPRYYRYFATTAFSFKGRSIRNHNRLLGKVEGVDGIKTGYTRASGFNLVSSMKRGNRHLVGVVLGGRSGGSRDAIMRNLLAENLEKGATRRTVAAVAERNAAEANAEVAEDRAASRPTKMVQVDGAVQTASAAEPDNMQVAAVRSAPQVTSGRSIIAGAAAALPPTPAQEAGRPNPARQETRQENRQDPAPLSNGVIQSQELASLTGSSEPMKPVRVKTVQVKSQAKLASASLPTTTSVITAPRAAAAETSGAMVARAEMPPQPANHGTGQGVLGVLPASAVNNARQNVASVELPAPARSAPAAVQQNGAIKPVAVHTGWIIQVGALESESEAKARLETARGQARGLLGKADPFTEPVTAKGDKKLYRARFAGLDRDQAEAACRTLKRSDISCIAIRN